MDQFEDVPVDGTVGTAERGLAPAWASGVLLEPGQPNDTTDKN